MLRPDKHNKCNGKFEVSRLLSGFLNEKAISLEYWRNSQENTFLKQEKAINHNITSFRALLNYNFGAPESALGPRARKNHFNNFDYPSVASQADI